VLCQGALGTGMATPVGTETHERCPRRNPAQPRVEAAPVVVPREGMAEPNEHILHHVVRVIARSGQPIDQPMKLVRMPMKERRERLAVAASNAVKQRLLELVVLHGNAHCPLNLRRR
jgi:hypothetical protein